MSAKIVSSLLGEEKTANGKIPVEHLEYDYIQNCTNLKYLEKILRVLRSGEEGVYPHLTEFCEKHIEKLDPKSRALRKENLLATAADFSNEEWIQIMDDLKIWETEIKMNEKEMKQPSFLDQVENLPAVRGSNLAVPLKQNTIKNGIKANTKKPVLPREYKEWDKFDVEKECSKIDGSKNENDFPSNIHQGLPKIKRKLDTTALTDKERGFLANLEKDKGNEAFRANDYEEAVVYYTRSLSVIPTAVAFNNRAQAEIKLQQWHNALNDCQKVLELEPSNLKALLRRATVHKQLGNLKMSADDLKLVLQAEPQNVIAEKMMQEVQKKIAALAPEVQRKGRKILIQEVESEEERAKPSLRVGGESFAAPGKRGDMGNAQKKSPSRGDAAHQTEPNSHGHRRGKRGSTDKHKAPEPAERELANGARGGSANGGSGSSNAGACADSSNLDAPCGALSPPLARLKNEGNQLFKNGQFADALEKYSLAITGCKDAGIDSPEDLGILYSNRAACSLKVGNSSDCIQDCTRALELQPFSLKPLLRRAMAYESLENYRKAYVDYKTVLQVDVGVQSAHDSIHRITRQLIDQDGPDWREKLPEIPLVPLSAQQHRKEEPPSAELLQARATRATEEAAKKAEARFQSLKQEGNDFVKKGQFQSALEKYSECLKLKSDECAIYTNRALCYLKLEHYAEAKQDCDSALKFEPSNKKAFYRRALAYKGLKDYLACSSDLQEVLQLDPNVQEAEQELEEVTVLLRQSLVTESPGKPRRSVPITEVDVCDGETDPAARTSADGDEGPDTTDNHYSGEHRLSLQPTNAYEFGQALNALRSRGDVAACAELLLCVQPETLPLYLCNKLDGDTVHFIMQALDEHLLQKDPNLVYQHLNHLHTADRFSMVLMLLGKNERLQMTQLFEHLSAAESDKFTANDVQNLANKYI